MQPDAYASDEVQTRPILDTPRSTTFKLNSFLFRLSCLILRRSITSKGGIGQESYPASNVLSCDRTEVDESGG